MKSLIRKMTDMDKYPGICGFVWKDLYGKEAGNRFSVATVEIKPSSASSLHFHKQVHEVYKIVAGQGIIELGTEVYEIGVGDMVYIPSGVAHRVRNTSNTRLLLVAFCSPPFSEADTVIVEE